MYRLGRPVYGSSRVSRKRSEIPFRSQPEPFSDRTNLVLIEKPIHGMFSAMNWYAAHELGISFPYSKDTILVRKGLSEEEAKWTLTHEIREAQLMAMGLSYEEAHLKTMVEMKDYGTLEEASEKEKAFLNQAKSGYKIDTK